jgi:hypothetical protein
MISNCDLNYKLIQVDQRTSLSHSTSFLNSLLSFRTCLLRLPYPASLSSLFDLVVLRDFISQARIDPSPFLILRDVSRNTPRHCAEENF